IIFSRQASLDRRDTGIPRMYSLSLAGSMGSMHLQGALVNMHEAFIILGRRVLPQHLFPSCLPHFGAELRAAPEPFDLSDKVRRIPRFEEQAIHSFVHDFRQTSDSGAYYWLAAQHRLNKGSWETFVTGAW